MIVVIVWSVKRGIWIIFLSSIGIREPNAEMTCKKKMRGKIKAPGDFSANLISRTSNVTAIKKARAERASKTVLSAMTPRVAPIKIIINR